MSEPFPSAVISDPNSPMPSPSPASGSTSTLFLAYPVSHLSKMDPDVDEETSSLPPTVPTTGENGIYSLNGFTPSPPPSPRATPISTPATPEVPHIPSSTSPASSTETGTSITPFNRSRPPNMSFASLNLHAQTLGHSITQHEGRGLGIVSSGSPAKADGGQVGGGGQTERVGDEAKMSPRGFVQPHRNHLPRRVKAKTLDPSIPAPQTTPTPPTPSPPPALPLKVLAVDVQNDAEPLSQPHSVEERVAAAGMSQSLTSAAEGSRPGDTAGTTMNATPPLGSSPTGAATNVAEDINSSIAAISTLSNPPTTSAPSSSPHLPLDTVATPTASVPLTPPLAPLPSSAHPHRNSSPGPGPSPLGGNLPRRIVSKRRPIRHPLSLSALASAAAAPPSGPTPPHSASGAQTPTSVQRTPLRSSLRTPGKTPLRSAALAASPFMSSSESGSDADGDRGAAGYNSGSPRTSGAAVVGSTPVHTPARGVEESISALRLSSRLNLGSDQPEMTTEVESGLKKKGKGRRATFGPLPFPIHGEPRSTMFGAELVHEDIPSAGPARLAIASAAAVAIPSAEFSTGKASDAKCTQYFGAGVYVGFLVDEDNVGEDFWGIPTEPDDVRGEEGKLVLDEGEDEEKKERMRRIVLRVLSEEEEELEEEDPDVLVDVVTEDDDEDADAVEPPSLLSSSSPPSPPVSSAQNPNPTVLATQDPAPVPSSSTSDSHGQPEPPPRPSPSLSPPLPARRHRHEHKRRHRERELVFTLPPPLITSSSASSSNSDVHSELYSQPERSLVQCKYVDGTSVLSDMQMRKAWAWMRDWMMGLDEDDDDDDVSENRNDSDDCASERDESNDRSGGSRSRARTSRRRGTRSMSRKEGMSSTGGKTKSKSRRRLSHHRRHPQHPPSNIRIEILAPQERRVDAMGLGLGYLCLAHARVGLPGDDLEKLKDQEREKEGVYTPLHLMWMRLMDVGVRLDDHGDEYRFDGASGRRKRSLSRKRSISRKRSVSRKRTRSQSRLREAVDVNIALDVEEEKVVPIHEPDVNTDTKPNSNVQNEVQIEPVLDPPNAFQFNESAANVYSSSSSSSSDSSHSHSTSSSRCSSSQYYSSSDDDLDLDPCGYTDEDQPSDSRLLSLGADEDGRKISTGRFSGRLGAERSQTLGEAGEQITVHDIREEWRGVFSFDGLGKVWSGVEAFRSG